MQFKPKPPTDDQERIRSDQAHDVKIGGKAKVSLGGMSTAVVEVVAIGKSGITTKDAKGREYKFIWAHVVGPSGEKTDDMHEAAKPKGEPAEPMTKALPAKQAPQRALYIGDSIYFSDESGQAQHGLVAAVGKHGATVDCQDEAGKVTTHQVHHHQIIGHRKRAERKLVILDRGEDGSIAVDESGKRVFIHGQLPDDQPDMTKALSGIVQTADEAHVLSVVRSAIEPLQMALAAMQASHQAEIGRLATIVSALAGKEITLQLPEQTPATVHVDVNVPEQPAPVFSPVIQLPESPPPVVHVELPAPRKTITEIERNRDGDIIRAVQKEAEQ